MKKIYNAPCVEIELFETADIITVSVTINAVKAAASGSGVPVIDASKETFS